MIKKKINHNLKYLFLKHFLTKANVCEKSHAQYSNTVGGVCVWAAISPMQLLLLQYFWSTLVKQCRKLMSHTGLLAISRGLEFFKGFSCLLNMFRHGWSIPNVSPGANSFDMT